ncbi:hypothetical protein MCOR27_000827 [Pyricularia oryzae]|nr:STAM-binding protein [Pyricularia oryzae 70-15]KAH8848503.1 hypothetical protein MCOR01_001883 [Pyricularia oryzae]EHA53371.1 STAM-binding protein [Pyricularia oryzae 70-15]KAH9429545.1 hypothetical protein MCOR02_009281 [Pyricularia oryzae]KAI6257310.1 hypothetical protein MCOR19_006243 [Pyricularia oryzae]KAI6272555.1 hypothetical protein MCOR26_007281 [Pyricularia oryzae]
MEARTMPRPRRPPLTIAQIVEQADQFEFNINIHLKHWVGAAETLYREGEFYKEEGNFAKAYLLLLRHCSLVLKKFPEHPMAHTRDGRKLIKPLQERLTRIISELEDLKRHINEAYNEWERLVRTGQIDDRPVPDSRYDKYAAQDPALSWNNATQAQLLDAGNNQELAVRLAKDDYIRRDAARRSIRQAGVSEYEEQIRRSGGVWEDWDARRGMGPRNTVDDRNDIQRQIQETRRRLDRSNDQDSEVVVRDFSYNDSWSSSAGSRSSRPPIQNPASQHYNYPSVSRPRPLNYNSYEASPAPSRPPKEQYPSYQDRLEPLPPPIPRKAPEAGRAPPTLPPKTLDQPEERNVQNSTSSVDRAVNELSKRKNITFLPAGYTEAGKPLRPIFVPRSLKDKFLEIAGPNTRKGLELCGIICGRPINNALFVAALLIPNQICTSDTCETEDEFQIFEFCEKENMIIIGWIHTHPTQTCFMSSRDLHTHASYQAISPESVAIVCAPKYNDFGVFRLTDPPGLPHVLRCPHTNTFHQHELPESEIYKDALHPVSHVYMSDQIDFDVTDLRPK